MNQFKDVKGGVWTFPEFTLGLVLDVKAQANVDFLGDDSRGSNAGDDAGKWFEMLYDPRHLGAVLWVIFESEITRRKLDYLGFARLVSGPALDEARRGIVSSLVSFIHSPNVAAAIAAELPQIQSRMETALLARWKSTVSGLLESWESTRVLSA